MGSARNEHRNLDGDNLHVSKGFTGASNGSFETKDQHGNTYWEAMQYLPACLDVAVSTSAPPTETDGAIYLLDASGAPHANWDGAAQGDWVRYSATAGTWQNITPVEGFVCYDKDSNTLLLYSGSAWASASTSPSIGGTLTSATAGSVLFAGSGTFAQDNSNFFWNDTDNLLGLGINSSLDGRLHIKGVGATSATNALYVSNSTPSLLFMLQDDGMFSLGISSSNNDYRNVVIGGTAANTSGTNSTITGYGATSGNSNNSLYGAGSTATTGQYNNVFGRASSAGSYNYQILIGNNIAGQKGNSCIQIGDYNNQGADYATTVIHNETFSYTNRTGTYDCWFGTFTHSASSAGSSGFNTGYGANQRVAYGGNQNNNSMFGYRCSNVMDTGGNYSGCFGAWTQIGNSTTANVGIFTFGSGDGSNYLANAENYSLIIGFKDQYESFKLYKRGVFVFNGANAASVVDGTNCDSSATNTMAIVSGTAPVTAVANTAQMFSNDSGQLSYLDENGFTISL